MPKDEVEELEERIRAGMVHDASGEHFLSFG